MTRRHGIYIFCPDIRGVLCYYRRWDPVARRGGKSKERLTVNNNAYPFPLALLLSIIDNYDCRNRTNQQQHPH
jgi:hypothetical protein